MTKQQAQESKVPPQQGGCWYCHSMDRWEDMRFDSEFDTNVHISCVRETIELCGADEPGEAHLMAYILTDTNPDNMMYPPWEPPDFSKLPKMDEKIGYAAVIDFPPVQQTLRTVVIDGEVFLKPIDWEEGDDE